MVDKRHESSPASSELDRLHTALAADDRRAILQYFQSADDDVASLDDLVESLYTRDDQSADREQVAIRLHHATLPKLSDIELLDYDARTRTVRYYGHPLLSEWGDCGLEGGELAPWDG